MSAADGFYHTMYVKTLRNQQGREHLCPYPDHKGRVFLSWDQLYDHGKAEHSPDFDGLDPQQARAKFHMLAAELKTEHSSIATAGDHSAPDIATLTLGSGKGSVPNSSPSGRKRPAEHEAFGHRGKALSGLDVSDSDYSRKISYRITSDKVRSESPDPRFFNPKQNAKDTSSPHRSTPEPSSEWSGEATKSTKLQSPQPRSPVRIQPRSTPKPQNAPSQPNLTSHPQYDERYPDLLLQPDSRPISQEQLASEVKSIYAGLAMVENKCIHVDRAQAAAVQDPNTKLPPDHWQALIALHRTLLHEHHDFFLASQHPSASPALRRLAAKYSMPARMWKHGIHSFLELLRRRLPDSMDYMLAFIYLAYQMMALLYETVPAFEDTWIECLGDLGRYRMAIEDEDVRDRDTWAGVARSWYTKAADKNPIVGRLYHHLAILARPNALQQIYYYSRSLTCVKPFGSARESIRTLLDPVVDHNTASLPHALPIDVSFIKPHALQFLGRSVKDDRTSEEFLKAKTEFLGSLDNYIVRVTTKWKDQGVWVAVTNIAGWFDYGVDDNALRQAFLIELSERAKNSLSTAPEEKSRTASTIEQQDPIQPCVNPSQIQGKLEQLAAQQTFKNAQLLTNDTFALALRRLGDKNVLLHVNIMLSYLTSLSSFSSCAYVPNLIKDTPWPDLVTFLNTLLKTESQSYSQTNTSQSENIDSLLSAALFPADDERTDELPLPEDYLARGLIWTHGYFPKNWFSRERDEEERYLEPASTVKNRINRVLRLGYALAKLNRWIAYHASTHSFSVIGPAP
ncbi:hypothetical protein COCHEDRAFT_1118043 [Bipolaris maydis C5]|uniref:DNA/RNA-binding domain-containing protein n=1 Tax=Cochliobolus heterostrophus (strain C5 / ATCC 48332 / race O) TaxID=701091 RepID=M2TH67_COCH5|nr:hypothetical protein COCHEDRAFT_1118043 [Bipolaris maydis C5]KAJ5026200.1 hypothetical protein J3E73DRAFT_47475 [Bipolaris maydis]KAJ5056738.1 hypothetical protein J3E74DRAFT_15184 [Bipolaris maydis]KAJ6196325.1 hypothetical protein J3E72DRAFT_50102 [Bipolaris maydis]KAJ6208430.1 hypothetical protein PSV09DRAFT_1118043 [Bipolaris maydis]